MDTPTKTDMKVVKPLNKKQSDFKIPFDEIPPIPVLVRQRAVDANGNDPDAVPQIESVSINICGG